MSIKKAKIKSVKFKRAKVKPVRAAKAPRGKGGRFKTKASVRGKADIKQFFQIIDDSAFEIARRELLGIATATAREIQARILNQNMPGMGGRAHGRTRNFNTPLHPFTLEQKELKGYDKRTLIARGDYVNNIGVVEIKKGKGYTYRVGFRKNIKIGDLPIDVLGRIMEYGARIKVTPKMRAYLHYKGLHLKKKTDYIIIPARPHFMPVFLRIKRELKEITKWTNKQITKQLKKKLGIV